MRFTQCLSLLLFLCCMEVHAETTAVRSEVLHFINDPDKSEYAYQYWLDGLLVVEDGRVVDVGGR